MSVISCNHDGPKYVWHDPSNHAITNNSTPLCRACYQPRYGTPSEFRRPDEADLYWHTNGTLGTHNLLLSGDQPDRDTIRARFNIIDGKVI